MIPIVLLALSALALTASLMPFLRFEGWWVRGFDFPRLQFASLAAVLLTLDLITLDQALYQSWIAAAFAASALFIQIVWILPFTRIWPHEVPPQDTPKVGEEIAIITVNVLQTNRQSESLLQSIRKKQPDIIVALETDKWWQSQLDSLETEDDYCYSIKCPLDNLYGMLVYSKLPLENAKTQFLVEEDVPSMHTILRMPSGREVSLHFLHPAPPSPSENTESSQRDAELIMVGKSLQPLRSPAIITGDLNDTAWSATTRLFRKASGLLDPRIGRGMFNTFHAEHWFLRWPLDHLFCSPHFRLCELQCLPYIGSDHFPVYMRLALAEQEKPGEKGLETDRDERERMKEKLGQENAKPSEVHRPEEQ